MSLEIHTIVSMPFAENTYIVWQRGQTETLVIDPGFEPDAILEFMQERELTASAILNTHGHPDHIAGNGRMKQAFPDAPLVIGENETELLTNADANLSNIFGLPLTSPPADRTVREGDVIDYAGIPLEVLDVPGHSPGHVVFVYRDEPCLVFGGDVVFRGSIGRHDFPHSDGPLLLEGIRTKILTLPPDTVIYSGHGPVTTVEHEKKHNPFIGI